MSELDDFLKWYGENCSLLHFVPLHNAVQTVSGAYGLTTYRQDNFQVQMWVIPPNYIIPEHTHPNVDSYEVYIGGQTMFSHSGVWLVSDTDMAEPTEHGLAAARGNVVRVKPNDLHGGCFGPSGGSFLSVQEWLNGEKPSCVSNDYEGIALGEEHTVDVGDVIHKELTWRDAASLEDRPPYWLVEECSKH